MPQLVAGLLALTALAASILTQTDAVTTLVRGAGAYVTGMVLATIWTFVVAPPRASDETDEDSDDDFADDEDDEVESDDAEDEDSLADAA
ncbi:MAG: hypothetical protein IH944_09655 [Armatimonadetes bacterium]|nr:hypothetical protein [Armatimonadota bacterium]